MNTNFGKLENGSVKYAPDSLVDSERTIFYPTAEQYLACGWKAVNAAAPSEPAPTGYHYEADGWSETATTITSQWRVVADPVIPRKWTRLKLKTAIAQAGWLPQVKTMLGGVEIAPSYTALEAFTDCDYVEEFWPDAATWGNLLDTVAANLGKSRAEIDAFIATVPTDPGATMEG